MRNLIATVFVLLSVIFGGPLVAGTPGTIDTTCGQDGTTTLQVEGTPLLPNELARQRNGGIIIVGDTRDFSLPGNPENSRIFVARLDENCNLDGNFGNSGIKIVDIPANGTGNISYWDPAVVVQSNNKIVVAAASEYYPVVFRLTTNGTIDGSFGNAGFAIDPQVMNGSEFGDVALQNDGKILILEGSDITRFQQNGALDTVSFGSGSGSVYMAYPDPSYGVHYKNLWVMGNDKILVGGTQLPESGYFPRKLVVARLRSDGIADSEFGNSGYVVSTYDFEGNFGDILLEPQSNKIIIMGAWYQMGWTQGPIERYLQNGSPDTSFGSGGRAVVYVSYNEAISRQSNGKILASTYKGVSRFTDRGAPDSTFGANGTVDLGYYVQDILWQPDGKVLVVRYTSTSPRKAFIQRIYADPLAADLRVEATSNHRGSAKVGKWIDYRIKVSNSGPDAAQNTTLAVTLPAGMQVGDPNPGCASGICNINMGSIGSGSSDSVTIRARATIAASPATLTASVSCATGDHNLGDTNLSNNSATYSLTIRP